VTLAALATYALAEYLHLPLALWAVLTAIILTQLSVGRTLKATIDYFVGTLSGAVFSSLVATLIPHASELGTLAVLVALVIEKNGFGCLMPINAKNIIIKPAICWTVIS
jgi:uncharacterized membrane protein YccC